MIDNIFDEIIGHVNRAKELMEKSDDVSPHLANMALKAQVSELILALGKLCKEVRAHWKKVSDDRGDR